VEGPASELHSLEGALPWNAAFVGVTSTSHLSAKCYKIGNTLGDGVPPLPGAGVAALAG